MTDIDGSRVLEVVEDRTTESAEKLWESLPQSQQNEVRAVAMDMWKPFIKAARKHVPESEIVHDKFHIAKYLNDGVDKVRRRENRMLRESEDTRRTGTKQLWLYAKKNLSRKRQKEIHELQDADLKTARAWSLKENFRWFWRYVYATSAEGFFDSWYDLVIESAIKPMIKVAKMLQRHLPAILSYFRYRITNGRGRIQLKDSVNQVCCQRFQRLPKLQNDLNENTAEIVRNPLVQTTILQPRPQAPCNRFPSRL